MIEVLGKHADDSRAEYSTPLPFAANGPLAVKRHRHEALSKRLFPGLDAIGGQFNFDNSEPSTIVGIIDRLQAPDPHHANVSGDPDLVEYAILVSQLFYQTNSARYLLRAEPGRRDDVIASTASALVTDNADRTLENIGTLRKSEQSPIDPIGRW